MPTGLTAVAASGTQINLSWTDNSAVETGFKIERKQGLGGTYQQITIAPPNSTSFMDTALLVGTTYYYRVKAANFGSDSAYSNEANAMTPVPPNTPSDCASHFSYQGLDQLCLDRQLEQRGQVLDFPKNRHQRGIHFYRRRAR